MKKGMSGKVMTFVISLIIAVFALAILWFVLGDIVKYVSLLVEKSISGIRCKYLCKQIGPLKLGFCKGC